MCGFLIDARRLPTNSAMEMATELLAKAELNGVFFPRCHFLARSLDCGFTRRFVGTVAVSLLHSCGSPFKRQGIATLRFSGNRTAVNLGLNASLRYNRKGTGQKSRYVTANRPAYRCVFTKQSDRPGITNLFSASAWAWNEPEARTPDPAQFQAAKKRQPLSRSYESILPNSLTNLTLRTIGYLPWIPDAVIGTEVGASREPLFKVTPPRADTSKKCSSMRSLVLCMTLRSER